MKNSFFRFESSALVALAFVMVLYRVGLQQEDADSTASAARTRGDSARRAAPPAAKPVVAEFAVEPSTIERGQSAVLRWRLQDRTNVSINNGIGTVPASGNRRVTPAETTTYTLTATGPGGDTTATATVTVTPRRRLRRPLRRTTRPRRGTLESRVQSDLRDALFDYDSNNIRDDARAALTADADALKRIFADFPTPASTWKGTATSAVRPNTTSVLAIAAHRPPAIFWLNWAFRRTG